MAVTRGCDEWPTYGMLLALPDKHTFPHLRCSLWSSYCSRPRGQPEMPRRQPAAGSRRQRPRRRGCGAGCRGARHRSRSFN